MKKVIFRRIGSRRGAGGEEFSRRENQPFTPGPKGERDAEQFRSIIW